MLLNAGADVNARDGSGMTALQYAVSNGNVYVVPMLLGNEDSKWRVEEPEKALAMEIRLDPHISVPLQNLSAWESIHARSQQCKELICKRFGLPFEYQPLPKGRKAWTIEHDHSALDKAHAEVERLRNSYHIDVTMI